MKLVAFWFHCSFSSCSSWKKMMAGWYFLSVMSRKLQVTKFIHANKRETTKFSTWLVICAGNPPVVDTLFVLVMQTMCPCDDIIIPPAQRSCWGGILVSLLPSVCPSVRPSVRPSVPHAVSALYHLQLWMDSFHIRHKWSLPWEGVSRTMTFDLDLYLQGHSALT